MNEFSPKNERRIKYLLTYIIPSGHEYEIIADFPEPVEISFHTKNNKAALGLASNPSKPFFPMDFAEDIPLNIKSIKIHTIAYKLLYPKENGEMGFQDFIHPVEEHGELNRETNAISSAVTLFKSYPIHEVLDDYEGEMQEIYQFVN